MEFKAIQKITRLEMFADNVADRIYLAPSHAKIALIQRAGNQRVVIWRSQNLTRGDRFEASAVIFGDIVSSGDKSVFDLASEQLDNMISDNALLINDFFKRQDSTD